MNELELAQLLAGNQQTALEELSQGASSLPLGAISATVDALTGSNLAQNAEAINNQKSLLLSGSDAVSQGLRQQEALEQQSQEDIQRDLDRQLKQEELARKEARQARLDQLKFESDQRREARADETLRLRKQLADQKSEAGGKNSIRSQREERLAGKDSVKFLNDFDKDIQNVVSKDLIKTQNQLGSLKEALRGGNLATIKSQISNFAKAISGESGVLTDQDINRQFRLSLTDKAKELKQFFSGKVDAQLRPEERERLSGIVNAALTERRKAYQAFVARKSENFRDTATAASGLLGRFIQKEEDGTDILGRRTNRVLEDISSGLEPLNLEDFEELKEEEGGFLNQLGSLFTGDSKPSQAAPSGLSKEEEDELAALEAEFGGN